MGCDYDYVTTDKLDKDILKALRKSNDDTISKFANITNSKNYEILKHIKEENEILSKKLKQKIDEYYKKREDSEPLQIATGKCGNPCFAFQFRLLFYCPKCKGSVVKYMENAYETQFLNEYGAIKKVKNYKNENICTRFNFNESIDKCDVDTKECIKFYEKIDEQKTVHWSCDIKEDIYQETPVIHVEKDMPIHYMMLDGERFDFPYGIHMKEFFILNDNLFFHLYFIDDFIQDEEFKDSPKHPDCGEHCEMFWDGAKNELGQSCGYYGSYNVHKVYIYKCDDCRFKYHVIKTSPFHFRDKSKDQK